MLRNFACPGCGTNLITSDISPPVLTCPRCFSRVNNPFFDSAKQGAPVPVIPLEQQVTSDSRWSRWLVFGMVVLFIASAIASIQLPGAQARVVVIVLLTLFVLACAAIPIIAAIRSESAATEDPPANLAEIRARFEERRVLEYRTARGYGGGVSAVATTGGCFAAIAICATGFAVLAGPAHGNQAASHQFILLGVFALVLGFAIFSARIGKHRPRWRGFGLGAAIGLGFGLLALAPCALCYMMTI